MALSTDTPSEIIQLIKYYAEDESYTENELTHRVIFSNELSWKVKSSKTHCGYVFFQNMRKISDVSVIGFALKY